MDALDKAMIAREVLMEMLEDPENRSYDTETIEHVLEIMP